MSKGSAMADMEAAIDERDGILGISPLTIESLCVGAADDARKVKGRR